MGQKKSPHTSGLEGNYIQILLLLDAQQAFGADSPKPFLPSLRLAPSVFSARDFKQAIPWI
jgi:hypothetical protein